MNLFGKQDKETEEQKEALEIKAASSQETPKSQDNKFINPFNKTEQQGGESVPEFNMNDTSDLFNDIHEDIPQQTMPNMKPSMQQAGQMPKAQMQTPQYNPPQTNVQHFTVDEIQEMIDETVEKIIDDKWDKVVSNVEKVISWKEQLEKQINMLKEDILHMKDEFQNVEKRIANKLNSYDKDIMDVGSEIKALEKVFQKITPTLVNNVNELSRIATTLKESNNSKTIELNDEPIKKSNSK